MGWGWEGCGIREWWGWEIGGLRISEPGKMGVRTVTEVRHMLGSMRPIGETRAGAWEGREGKPLGLLGRLRHGGDDGRANEGGMETVTQ